MGQVARPTLKSDAKNAVKHIKGVERVDNQIQVLPTSPMDDQIRMATYRATCGNRGDRAESKARLQVHDKLPTPEHVKNCDEGFGAHHFSGQRSHHERYGGRCSKDRLGAAMGGGETCCEGEEVAASALQNSSSPLPLQCYWLRSSFKRSLPG
jgi:hypothetical protein